MTTDYRDFSVCYQKPTHCAETIVQARSKEEACEKVLARINGATAVRWVIEVPGSRGWI